MKDILTTLKLQLYLIERFVNFEFQVDGEKIFICNEDNLKKKY